MREQQINRLSGRVAIVWSLTALITVLIGYKPPPETDASALAHIFQLSIVGLVPTILLFLVTADWRRPWRSTRRLALPTAALVVAFVVRYYLEHYR